ncbi:MAG TPA: hypothetical protein VEU62_21975 [Bryobacterales bacterium]|nr:hypothetical protein [Bryobacterales bacterium]
MPRPIGVIDASCVIALDALKLLPQLTLLFHRLFIPKAVRHELYRRRLTKNRISALLKEYTFVQPCDDYDQAAVDVLLTERSRKAKKHRGEAETVVQATTLGAMAVIDDPWGRKLAGRYSLECHGTLWVLERSHALHLLTPPVVRQHLRQLKDHRIHFPVPAANQLLRRLGEPEI